jgi:PEGA domain
MNKKFLFTILGIVFLFATPAVCQWSPRGNVVVPFEFAVGKAQLPAGNYFIFENPQSHSLQFVNADTGKSAFSDANDICVIPGNGAVHSSKLDFSFDGKRQLVHQVLLAGDNHVYDLLHGSDAAETRACQPPGENKVLAELRLIPHGGADKTAGVWVDGQYVGYVKELKGDKKVLLMPGRHKIVVRQPWYKEYVEDTLLQPGELHTVTISLVRNGRTLPVPATAELKISATPARAAVFVDNQFTGHVDEFDGPGQAILLIPGQHRLRIALPGYLPFDHTVDLRPNQKLRIQTALVKGSITEAGSLVTNK